MKSAKCNRMQTATSLMESPAPEVKKETQQAKRHIEIMDTTLRDGEQTSGVSFSASEKLTIAQLLLTEVKVDRIEIASARVSEGEFKAVKKMMIVFSNSLSARKILQTSKPDFPGIITSSMIRSGLCNLASLAASLPLVALITW